MVSAILTDRVDECADSSIYPYKVLSKVFVYSGIGVLAIAVIPAIFRRIENSLI